MLPLYQLRVVLLQSSCLTSNCSQLLDLSTNAQRKGHNSVYPSEEISECVWVHFTSVSWAGIIKLCVESSLIKISGIEYLYTRRVD